MINKTRAQISGALKGAKNPAVLCSFGKDSLLLLYLCREVNPNVNVIWYSADASKEQRAFASKVIKLWGLTVYSYSPASRYFLPKGGGLVLTDEYSFGGEWMPMLTDISEGQRCAAGLSKERTPYFAYPFDVTLSGWKKTDEQFVIGGIDVPADGFRLGPTAFYSPFRDWTDAEVLEAIKQLRIPYEAVDDTLSLCTACLQSTEPVYCPEAQKVINPVAWQPQQRLAEFRERFL
jgi:hypothetical protein